MRLHFGVNNDSFVKSRHTREGGCPETLQLFEKTGFPIKNFGNDGLKKDFLRPSIIEGD